MNVKRLARLAQQPLLGFALFAGGAWLEVRRLVDAHRFEGAAVDEPIVIGIVLGLLSVLAPIGWRAVPRGPFRRVTGWALVGWIGVLVVGFVLTHHSRYRAAAGEPPLVHPYLVVAVACWATILVALLVIVPVLAWRHPDGPSTSV